MILDAESGTTWHCVRRYHDPVTGGEFREYLCREWPRLRMQVQRPHRDMDSVTTYSIEGVVNYYHNAREALAAAEANP